MMCKQAVQVRFEPGAAGSASSRFVEDGVVQSFRFQHGDLGRGQALTVGGILHELQLPSEV